MNGVVRTIWDALRPNTRPNGGTPVAQIEFLLRESGLADSLNLPSYRSFRNAWFKAHEIPPGVRRLGEVRLMAKNEWKRRVALDLVYNNVFPNLPIPTPPETAEPREWADIPRPRRPRAQPQQARRRLTQEPEVYPPLPAGLHSLKQLARDGYISAVPSDLSDCSWDPDLEPC